MKKRKQLGSICTLISLSSCIILGGCTSRGNNSTDTTESTAMQSTNVESTVASKTEENNMSNKLIIPLNTSQLDESYDISQLLYGIFLEDINFAVDGGLYAELIKNRSFEYGEEAQHSNKHGWNSTSDNIRFEVQNGAEDGTSIAEVNPNYAILTNSNTDYEGISNNGYLDGLAITEGANYNFSVFLKSPDGYTGTVKVSLRDSNGEVYAEGIIDSITGDWWKYSLTLTASATVSSNLKLYVEIEQGTVWMDMVSFMPQDTYKGRENGIRKDIGEYLEALHPKFLRFPGGCVIEGKDLESIYSWKDSIGNGTALEINGELTTGDVAVRPQGKSIWSGNSNYPYYTTYGIGFYEYFLLCEDLSCLPVPVLNAGMTCQVQSPQYIVFPTNSDEFKQCIQDALDLVEFCRGDANTYWGSVRIAMGHEEPFELKYIGIGNEQWQSEYYQHYTLFVQAFDEAAKENPDLYGDIQLIVANSTSSGDTVGWDYVRAYNDSSTTGLVDEHYYESADWFFSNNSRYDTYERSLNADVFLGEYAAQANTLYAALAEASYMTGLERNGDVVKMACYAPLFANSSLNQWTPDMIWFNNHTVHGSVNYYVQQMFSNNLGTTYLPATLEQAENNNILSGFAGLGSWVTSVAYDNFKVISNTTGETLCEYDFEDESQLRDWQILAGNWSIQDGKLVQSNTADPININSGDAIYIGNSDWSEYTLTVDAEILNGNEGFLIPVTVKSANDSIFWNLGGWGNTVSCLQIVSSGTKSGQISGTAKNISLKKNQVYKLKVVVDKDSIQCYIDNILYIDYQYTSKSNLYQSTSLDENGDIIIKLVNSTDTVQSLDVVLEDFNSADYESNAQVTTLANEDASITNTYKEPDTVIPVESTYEISEAFTYELPAYSLTVMRISAK